MLEYLRIWEAWDGCQQALHARYEDLLTGYEEEARRLVAFLGLDPGEPAILKVIEQFRPTQAQSGQKGIHFNKGVIGRFRQRTTPKQQELMAEKFAPYLERMGYEI